LVAQDFLLVTKDPLLVGKQVIVCHRLVIIFWSVKQPSWHTARACGESAKQPSVSAMRTGRIVVFLD
jgi:hypothetical protein